MLRRQFNQIDPTSTRAQSLINWNFRTYNFDVIDGVSYQIDVTQPARYDEECQLIHLMPHVLGSSLAGATHRS